MTNETDQITEKPISKLELDLANILDAIDVEKMPYGLTIYCQHTGKACGKIDNSQLQNLLHIHGKNTTVKVIQYMRKGVSPEWLWLNSEGLDNLALMQPKEYFIYVASLLLQRTNELHKIDQFEQKILAWENLANFETELIRPIAEICRRIVAKIQPSVLTKQLNQFESLKLGVITQTLQNLSRFQLELEHTLRQVIKREKEIDDANKRGFMAFSKQKLTAALSQLEIDLQEEFNDWDLIPGKEPEKVEAIIGQKYGNLRKTIKPQKPNAKQYDGKAVVTNKFSGLKFGGKK